MDDERWQGILAHLPAVEQADGAPLAVAFIAGEDFLAKRGRAWLWWPGDRQRATGPVPFAGNYPDDWGLLLVMNEAAIAKVGADGTACMACHWLMSPNICSVSSITVVISAWALPVPGFQ